MRWERDAQRRKLKRAIIIDTRKRGSCAICGCTACTLTFHHIGPKRFCVGFAHKLDVSIGELYAEMRKCVLVCEDCHRELHD